MNETITMYAFRYALGRRTYAASDMVEYIIKYWNFMRKETRNQIKSEINQYKERYGNLGDSCDEEQWNRILNKEIN